MDEKRYQLCRIHTVKKAFLIKVAHVGLYLTNCQVNKGINVMQMDDKLVRFKYLVNIKSGFFQEAAYEFFVKNFTGVGTTTQLAELIKFNQFYQDMGADESYDLYLAKGQQLKLYKNQNLLGSSNDADFSQRYFTIWFGQYPAIKKLKKAFLPQSS